MQEIPSPYASDAEAQAAIQERLAAARKVREEREAAAADEKGIGFKGKLAIGGIALTGFAAASGLGGQVINKVGDVFRNINTAAQSAGSDRSVPESQDALIQQARETINANEQSHIDAQREP